MYNRTPYVVTNGVSGSLMGRTMGYLTVLLVILAISATFSPLAGPMGMWIGFFGAIIGTIMASRRVANAGQALAWGALVAVGMGLLAGPFVWQLALTNQQLLVTTSLVVVLAVATSALLVSWIPWDFSRIGPLLFMGLLMLLAAGVLSWIIPGMTGVVMSRTYNLIGTIIFIGYLIVDFSIMRYRGRVLPAEGTAVVLAVALLVDIVNLFLFVARLGRR